MILQDRIQILIKLGEYIKENNTHWQQVKEQASYANAWFIDAFIETSTSNVANHFLEENVLQQWVTNYQVPDTINNPKKVGIVMAGNIPLVGFHDFLCVFISGHIAVIKTSSKDHILLQHLIAKMLEWNPALSKTITIADNLKNCDAYIATGSNNSSKYFEYYFGKYPNIIRKNRTSVAILTGNESQEELNLLADDIQQYFGLGCRNVTKLYVPKHYNFTALLEVLKRYEYLTDFHKYKHNYDYHLALLIMGNKLYMNNGSIVLTEDENLFSPISQINYEFYENETNLINSLKENNEVQCIVAKNGIRFGNAQAPVVTDYADGIDTMNFLLSLP